MVGRFSYSPQAGHLWSSFGAWWGDSLTRPRLGISGRPSARGGAILLLAPGWTSLVILRRVVGRFSYSPQAGHVLSSFSMRRTTMKDVQPGVSKRISPPCSVIVIQSVVGKFSYSSQAGHLIVVWRMVASKRLSQPCTEQRQKGPDCDEKENLHIML